VGSLVGILVGKIVGSELGFLVGLSVGFLVGAKNIIQIHKYNWSKGHIKGNL